MPAFATVGCAARCGLDIKLQIAAVVCGLGETGSGPSTCLALG